MSVIASRIACCSSTLTAQPQNAIRRWQSLSDRELEVFRLIGEGHSTRKIAEELHLSVKTVESYQAHIKEKLSLKSGRELVQRAIQWTIDEGAATAI